MHHYHPEDSTETLFKILITIASIPIITTLLVALVAGCFTIIWHIGNWVGWW
jgi:hypothetical protein